MVADGQKRLSENGAKQQVFSPSDDRLPLKMNRSELIGG